MYLQNTLQYLIYRSLVLFVLLIPCSKIYAQSNRTENTEIILTNIYVAAQSLQAAKVSFHRSEPNQTVAIATSNSRAPRISRCDRTTGFIRVRRLPLCQFDRDGADLVQHKSSEIKYRLLVEKGLEQHATVFAQDVAGILNSDAGWRKAGLAFARVRSGEDLTIILARPAAVDRLCRPLDTQGRFSCAISGRAVINVARWLGGAATWGTDVKRYRYYLINHEVGHLLGLSHTKCLGRGQPAPIMLQQTINLHGCVANGDVTTHDLAMIRQYLPILRSRLAQTYTGRLKKRPQIVKAKQKKRQRKYVSNYVRRPKHYSDTTVAFKYMIDN